MTACFDAIVVGAGPAGAAYAHAAARAGAGVLLIGRAPRHPPHTLELLAGRAREPLAALGLLEAATGAAPPCRGTLSRWHGGDFLERPSLLDPDGGGWIVDRAVLDGALLRAVVRAGAARTPHRASAAERGVRGWRVRVGDVWARAPRLVLASGRASGFPGRAGVTRRIAHRLVALVGWTPERLPELGERLFVDAQPEGWWFGIGTPAGTALGCCTDADLVRPATAHWRRVAGPLGGAGPRVRAGTIGGLAAVPPAGVQVIGDAALAVDPLSGHGLALAFESAARAADDPDGLSAWIAEVETAHAEQAAELYLAAGAHGAFWRRRLAA
jgi:flavin-dependent dehydrogenase